MASLKITSARVVNIETSLDAVPVDTPAGAVQWAMVTIDYTLAGLAPRVTIRVPLAWEPDQSPEQRGAAALRHARQLIDHACKAFGTTSGEPAEGEVAQAIESALPPSLAGLTQELGLAMPTKTDHPRNKS